MRRMVFAMTLLMMAGLPSAGAVTIDGSSAVGAVPGTAGTGLSAFYFKFDQAVGPLSHADLLVASVGTPTATFTALTVCFPACGTVSSDNDSLASYVAANGTALVGAPQLGYAVTQYKGYIAISSVGTHTFSLTSDDGSALYIGGTLAVNNDGTHGFKGKSSNVTFDTAGLYPFFLDHFEDRGRTGITLKMDGQSLATGSLYGVDFTVSPVPEISSHDGDGSGSLVPEPASIALLGIGIAVMVPLRRRVRR